MIGATRKNKTGYGGSGAEGAILNRAIGAGLTEIISEQRKKGG